MQDSELKFDRSCHTIYTQECKRQILSKITLHYPENERDSVWEKVQLQYVDYLSDWRTDLGGSKNFHNGKSGTYDCIALMSYYTVCKDKTSLDEIEEMEGNLILPTFKRLKFVDCNKPIFKRLMYLSFCNAKKQCDKWNDYKMNVAPFDKNKPIYYEFTECPVAQFAKQHNLLEVMPPLCNVDFAAMECIGARLVRKTTCSNGTKCDYTICGSRDKYINDHPEYVDEAGYRRNK